MLLTASSADVLVHSTLLTEFSVTGQNELPPVVLMNKISTHTHSNQHASKWCWKMVAAWRWCWKMVAGGGVESWCRAAVEDCSSGIGQQWQQKNMQ
jgi:hypothetical protein